MIVLCVSYRVVGICSREVTRGQREEAGVGEIDTTHNLNKLLITVTSPLIIRGFPEVPARAFFWSDQICPGPQSLKKARMFEKFRSKNL